MIFAIPPLDDDDIRALKKFWIAVIGIIIVIAVSYCIGYRQGENHIKNLEPASFPCREVEFSINGQDMGLAPNAMLMVCPRSMLDELDKRNIQHN